MDSWQTIYGPNVGYALELYDRYLRDPASVDEATRVSFQQMGAPNGANGALATAPPKSSNGTEPGATSAPASVAYDVIKVVAAARLARSIREYGHLDAAIDPLGRPRPGDPMLVATTHGITDADLAQLPASIVWPAEEGNGRNCLDAITRLREIYCGSIGYEFDHVQDFNERTWLHVATESANFRTPLPEALQRKLLQRLTQVEGMEQFLHTTFQGQKRFSLEGNDALVPMLDELVGSAEETGVGEVLLGMSHRGRLNVLAHILERPYATMFSEFHSAAKRVDAVDDPSGELAGGDVKYHRGAQRVRGAEGQVKITLADNPSHLEFVNPVVEGFARAAQDDRTHRGAPEQHIERALPITIHGDASFPGEGVVAETLNLSRLPGYRTGGTIHIIVNNQIGFTTSVEAGRSTLYASDLAKGFEIPIIHVNADDIEACLFVTRLAFAYHAHFHRDVLIDLVGYRRWGHNEADEPAFTQPQLYAEINSHTRARAIYADKLAAEGVVTTEAAGAMVNEFRDVLRKARDEGEAAHPAAHAAKEIEPEPVTRATLVSEDDLRALNEAMLARPEDFSGNPKLERVLARRRDALERENGIDWAHAEALALASILSEDIPIRFTGQDTERGTFSQRHLVLHDPASGHEYIPLQSLPQARASFAVYNSPLTEAAVLGFEYGYSVHAPEAFVIWEAQYGDFANAGQVLIDQFITAAKAKWSQRPSLVLLLPHGYEGQGPEHSSARLERYLQLAAGGNMWVVNPTTAAQYFHVLRLQAASLCADRSPLIVMTPKSLLRRAEAGSSLNELSDGEFQPVLYDPDVEDRREEIERLVLCSGKIAIELRARQSVEPVPELAVVRVEQLFPFPAEEVRKIVDGYPLLREIVWVQEEPRNMGAWTFISPHLRDLLPDVTLRYVGRMERASTAAGSAEVHEREQSRIFAAALNVAQAPSDESGGDHNGG